MTDGVLTPQALECLEASRVIALENLRFYQCLYDDLETGSERESIGTAMAQKQSFIGAADAILKNHEVYVPQIPETLPANDCRDVLKDIEAGEHLAQEERFYAAVQNCADKVEDDISVELLNHHLEAAEIALAAIKATSLKI